MRKYLEQLVLGIEKNFNWMHTSALVFFVFSFSKQTVFYLTLSFIAYIGASLLQAIKEIKPKPVFIFQIDDDGNAIQLSERDLKRIVELEKEFNK